MFARRDILSRLKGLACMVHDLRAEKFRDKEFSAQGPEGSKWSGAQNTFGGGSSSPNV